jgi:hypothetical protein
MPELRPIRAPAPRVRHAGNIKLQPTVQQRIDAAARAQKTDSVAAGDASSSSSDEEGDADGGRPGKRQKVQAGAAAAAGAGGAGRKAHHPAAAAAAAAADGGSGWRTKKGAQQPQQPQQQQKKRVKGFAASLNAGRKASVRAALQEKARTAQEQARAGGGRAARVPRPAAAAAAAAAGASDGGAERQQQQSPQQEEGDAFKQRLLHAHIRCQLVLTGVQPGLTMDPAEVGWGGGGSHRLACAVCSVAALPTLPVHTTQPSSLGPELAPNPLNHCTGAQLL